MHEGFSFRSSAARAVLQVLSLLPAIQGFAAVEPVVITSRSQQITVRGVRLAQLKRQPPSGSSLVLLDPALLAVTAENVRQILVRELGSGEEWRGRVFINLRAVRSEKERLLVHSIRTADGWNYRLELPDEMDAPRLARVLVEVFLMESANRQAGERPAELPPWLAPGLAAHLLSGPLDAAVLAPDRPLVRTQVNPDALDLVRARLGTNAPLSVDQLNWPAPDQFEDAKAAQYEASAHLFVRELLRLRDGPRCLREMLTLLPQHLNWQTSFLLAFRNHFQRLLDVEKWWALVLVNVASRDPARAWTRPQSLQRLDEILYTPVQVRLAEDDLPHESQVSLQTVLTEWPDTQRLPLLRHKRAQLFDAASPFEPDVAALAQSYGQVLDRYLRARAPLAEPDPASTDRPDDRALVRNALRTLKVLDTRRQKLWISPPPAPRANPPRAPAR